MKDAKESMTSRRKPDVTHVRGTFMRWVARACELGDDAYERANYMRSTGEGAHAEPTADDFRRMREYLRASLNHLTATLDSMEAHQSGDPDLLDVAGMKSAAYAPDADVSPQRGWPSRLAHLACAASSLQMAIVQAARCGLLPDDPGRPWDEERARAAAPAAPPEPVPAPGPGVLEVLRVTQGTAACTGVVAGGTIVPLGAQVWVGNTCAAPPSDWMTTYLGEKK